MEQGNLFADEPPKPRKSGKDLRDEALKRVERGVSDAWKATAMEKIIFVANEKKRFTADDIWEAGLKKPHEPRALGAMIRKAQLAGYIEPTPYFGVAKPRSRHAGPCRIWRLKQ